MQIKTVALRGEPSAVRFRDKSGINAVSLRNLSANAKSKNSAKLHFCTPDLSSIELTGKLMALRKRH